jgi:CNT family concentrative nucleoside transporter
MEIGQSLLGLGIFILFCWAISEGRREVPWRAVLVGVVFQIVLALVLLKVPPVQSFFILLNDAVLALQEATKAGTSFVFGYLGGSGTPFDLPYPGADFILTFQALPILIVMSALSSLLFYWGVLPFIVKLFSKVLEKTLGVGGAVGVGAAANIFVGMVEAPLFVRPYIKTLSRSELFVVMTCGMATIAGTVMVIYATFLTGIVENPLGQILTASLISAPAAIIVALIMVPGEQGTEGTFELPPPEAHGSMEAITIGTMQGVQLFVNVVALLLVMVALVALVNSMLGVLPDIAGAPLTLERMLGWIMAPVCWLMGIPWAEAQTAGTLMGVKTVLNEFIAYLNLSKLPEGSLSPRSSMIMTYALCGFANLGSLGIMIGGLIAIAPERRKEIVDLSGKSILSGTIATCMTGAVVGLLVW